MKHRMIVLALSGALSLSLLAGCAGNGVSEVPPSAPATTPSASQTVTSPSQVPATDVLEPTTSPEVSESPDASQAPNASQAPQASQTPSNTQRPAASHAPSTAPSTRPSATPKPTTPPSAKPTPAPTQPAVDVVNQVWNQIAKQELPALMDVDASILSQLYGIDASSLVSYVCKMPVTAVQATEFFIAEVKDGQMDTVKAGVLKRQADLDQQWSSYLPEQHDLVKNYQLVTSGNYILFAISEHASAAVSAFNSYTK